MTTWKKYFWDFHKENHYIFLVAVFLIRFLNGTDLFFETQNSNIKACAKNNNVDSMTKKMYTNNDTVVCAQDLFKTRVVTLDGETGIFFCYAWVILTPTIVCFFAASGHRVHVDLPGRLSARPLTAL